VEALLALDQALERWDEAWPGYLVTAVGAFVVSDANATRGLSSGTGRWLAGILSAARPSTAAAVARAVLAELRDPADTLYAIVNPNAKRRTKVMASATGLTSRKKTSRAASSPADAWNSFSYRWSEVRLGGPAQILRADGPDSACQSDGSSQNSEPD
jgi:hypothetical protein